MSVCSAPDVSPSSFHSELAGFLGDMSSAFVTVALSLSHQRDGVYVGVPLLGCYCRNCGRGLMLPHKAARRQVSCGSLPFRCLAVGCRLCQSFCVHAAEAVVQLGYRVLIMVADSDLRARIRSRVNHRKVIVIRYAGLRVVWALGS